MWNYILLVILFSSYFNLIKSCDEVSSKKCMQAVEEGILSSKKWSGTCTPNKFLEYTHICKTNFPYEHIDHCCCNMENKVFCCKYKHSWSFYRCVEWQDLIGYSNSFGGSSYKIYTIIIVFIVIIIIVFFLLIFLFCYRKGVCFCYKFHDQNHEDMQPSAPPYEAAVLISSPSNCNSDCALCQVGQECPLHRLPSYEESQLAHNNSENNKLTMI